MSKIANILNMLQILKDKEIHSISSLAEKLEVSERMVRQYKIKYKSINSGITERIIHPTELFLYIKKWYIAAFCELRNIKYIKNYYLI